MIKDVEDFRNCLLTKPEDRIGGVQKGPVDACDVNIINEQVRRVVTVEKDDADKVENITHQAMRTWLDEELSIGPHADNPGANIAVPGRDGLAAQAGDRRARAALPRGPRHPVPGAGRREQRRPRALRRADRDGRGAGRPPAPRALPARGLRVPEARGRGREPRGRPGRRVLPGRDGRRADGGVDPVHERPQPPEPACPALDAGPRLDPAPAARDGPRARPGARARRGPGDRGAPRPRRRRRGLPPTVRRPTSARCCGSRASRTRGSGPCPSPSATRAGSCSGGP